MPDKFEYMKVSVQNGKVTTSHNLTGLSSSTGPAEDIMQYLSLVYAEGWEVDGDYTLLLKKRVAGER